MCSYLTRNRKFQKNSQKIKKIRKHHHTFLSSQNRFEKVEKERKKKKITLKDSYPTGNRKFQKNSKKIQKFRKHHHSFFSSQYRWGKAEKERK